MVDGSAQIGGGGKYLSGALLFDGQCGFLGANVSGGINSQYLTTSASGSYNQNADGTFTLTMNLTGDPVQQTYIIGISESGNKARGIETDGTAIANIDLVSQLTTLTSGYNTASLTGTYAVSCYGPGQGVDLNYVTFDGNGGLSGVNPFNNGGAQGNLPYAGSYSVNTDGTMAGALDDDFSAFTFTGVIDAGVTEIRYTYNRAGQGGVVGCSGRQASATNLQGWYGMVVGGNALDAGKYLSGAVYFDGAGGLTSTNVNGGIGEAVVNTNAVGSYAPNNDNTVAINLNLAGNALAQSYIVGIGEGGNEAVGIETDGSAMATIDLQNQLPPSQGYSNASLNGTYSVGCFGGAVDLNWVTFDGNGNLAGVDPYNNGVSSGDYPYTGTYTVNSDGTFSSTLLGDYSMYTFTGVIENSTSGIAYTYNQAGTGEVVACIGESTYGPVGTAPVAATPMLGPAAGAYSSSQSVTLSDPTPGAVIYYTTDGTAPTIGSAVYSTPLPVNATTTVQAIAVAPGYNNSAISAGTYFYLPTLPAVTTPVLSPPPGTYRSFQSVTLATATPGATIYYTTDGSTPTINSAVYNWPITVGTSGLVQAIAVASGYGNSPTAGGVYVIGPVSSAGTGRTKHSKSNSSAANKPH